MRMRDFIRENREELDRCIDGVTGHVPKTAGCYCSQAGTDHYHQPDPRNDRERELWVRNDESLYNWARDNGVKI